MNKPQLLIRADASFSIGMGHRVRCQNLADEFNQLNWSVRFVCHQSTRAFIEVEDLLIGSEEEFLDLAQEANLVILDHYAYSSAMIEKLFTVQPNLFLIDDMNDRGSLYCRWLLNPVSLDYSNNLEALMEKKQKLPSLFIGSKYALLRSQFLHCIVDKKANKLLISMGGTDPLALTLPILESLKAVSFDMNSVIVMQGANAAEAEQVSDFCFRHKIEYHQGVSNVAALMAQAKLALSAGGSTLFELAAIGVPSLFIQVAENQTKLLQEHESLGWCNAYSFINVNLFERRNLVINLVNRIKRNWGNNAFFNEKKSKIPNIGENNTIHLMVSSVIEQLR